MIHLTVDTGHARMSPRSEVSDEVIAALRPLVRAGGGPLPGPPGYAVQITRVGRDAAFTVSRLGEGGLQAPLVTGILAVDDAVKAWGAVQTFRAGGQCPSATPWLAVVIHPTLSHVAMEAAPWLGDLERCIAWTIIEDSQ